MQILNISQSTLTPIIPNSKTSFNNGEILEVLGLVLNENGALYFPSDEAFIELIENPTLSPTMVGFVAGEEQGGGSGCVINVNQSLIPTYSACLSPFGVAFGPKGSLYIADTESWQIYHIPYDNQAKISAFAGIGWPTRAPSSNVGDGGPAAKALIAEPTALVTHNSTLYVSAGSRIREIDLANPPYVINTIVGTGVYGYSGDGGPATNAQISNPSGIAVGPDGSLYLADTFNNVIRRVSCH